MDVITQSTAISIGLFVTSVGGAVSAVAWLVKLNSVVATNTAKIAQIEEDLKENHAIHAANGERLVRIETKLDMILKKDNKLNNA